MPIYQTHYNEMLLELQQLLRLGADDVDLMDRWANLGYIDAVQRTEALQKTDTALLTPGCDSFNLPPEVLRIKQLVWVYPDGSESRPLEAIDLQLLLEMRRSTATVDSFYDRPWYTLVGENQLELWPTPGAGDALRFWYVRYPQALFSVPDSTFEIREPWGSKLVLYAAAVEAARFKKDPLLGDYEAVYAYWVDRYKTHINQGRGLSQFVMFRGDEAITPHDPSTDLFQLR